MAESSRPLERLTKLQKFLAASKFLQSLQTQINVSANTLAGTIMAVALTLVTGGSAIALKALLQRPLLFSRLFCVVLPLPLVLKNSEKSDPLTVYWPAFGLSVLADHSVESLSLSSALLKCILFYWMYAMKGHDLIRSKLMLPLSKLLNSPKSKMDQEER